LRLELVIGTKLLEVGGSGGMALLRPRDVVRLAAEGMRNQEIALKLNLAEHTVRNSLIRIFDELGISSRVELVLYALSGPAEPSGLTASNAAVPQLVS
jgi:DNA-binding CsgD family transcriptional regulator